MNHMDPGFSNTHFYKWGWFVAVELTQSEVLGKKRLSDLQAWIEKAEEGPQEWGNSSSETKSQSRRIHGTIVYLPTFTMKINHSCRFSYTNSHGCVMGIYEKSPKFHETHEETLRWFYKSFQCGGELNLCQLHIDGLLTEVGRNSDFPTKLKKSSLGGFWC